MDSQPPKHPVTFIRDINTREKKDDSSSPLKGRPVALAATISLFPKAKTNSLVACATF